MLLAAWQCVRHAYEARVWSRKLATDSYPLISPYTLPFFCKHFIKGRRVHSPKFVKYWSPWNELVLVYELNGSCIFILDKFIRITPPTSTQPS